MIEGIYAAYVYKGLIRPTGLLLNRVSKASARKYIYYLFGYVSFHILGNILLLIKVKLL